MQSAGAFCYLSSYAKSFQRDDRRILCDVWIIGCWNGGALHAHSINGRELRQQGEVNADGINLEAGARPRDP